MKLYIKKSISFILIFIILVIILEIVARDMYNNRTDLFFKHKCFRENQNEIEILFLGSSHTEQSVNPQYINKKAFNISYVSQDFYYDYAILKKYINCMPNLETIVLGLSFFSFGYDEEEYFEQIVKDYFVDLGILPRSKNISIINFLVFFNHKSTFIKDLIKGKKPIPHFLLEQDFVPDDLEEVKELGKKISQTISFI